MGQKNEVVYPTQFKFLLPSAYSLLVFPKDSARQIGQMQIERQVDTVTVVHVDRLIAFAIVRRIILILRVARLVRIFLVMFVGLRFLLVLLALLPIDGLEIALIGRQVVLHQCLSLWQLLDKSKDKSDVLVQLQLLLRVHLYSS